MKNIGIILLIVLSLVLTSCRRCVQCTEKTPKGEIAIKWPENCGKKADIQKFEDNIKSNIDPHNTIDCLERKTTYP